MSYWQLFYHLVWSTKHREPLLTQDVESRVHELLADKATRLDGFVFAVNGIADHVHMVVAIPPKVSVATFVGQVKGVASAKFNKSGTDGSRLYWQDEYGAFSFDAKRLPNYIAYVRRQKAHHAERRTIPVLERTDGELPRILREDALLYEVNEVEDTEWWQEMEQLG